MRKFLALLFAGACLYVYSCSNEESVKTKEELFKAITPAVQQKTIDPLKDNLIEGAKGIKIFIPANSLVFEDGSKATGPVTISLEEFISPSDFFSRKLSTVSGTALLETGGMINLTATAGGKSLRVDDAGAIVIAFPAKDTLTGMQTFYGDTISGGGVNWLSTGQLLGDAGLSLLDTSFINADPSLYEEKISVCGYLTTVNSKEITWKIKHPDNTVFNYVERNLKLTDSVLKRELCQNGAILDLLLSIDSTGKITDIELRDGPAKLLPVIRPFFLNMPPFDMSSMNTTSADAEYNLSICCHSKISPEKFEKKFEQKYAAYKDKALKVIGKTEISTHLLISKGLGWINCDRFYNDTTPKIDFVVTTTGVTNPQVMLIFEDISSVMQGEEKNGLFIFSNIPVNSKVKIVSTGEGKDKALLAVQSTIATSAAFKLDGYSSFSLNEFQQKLK